jgi:hypothetical protein
LVSEVERELFQANITSTATVPIIVSSDEVSPSWWSGVTERGWIRIDHIGEQTEEKYGEWFIPILDIVIQSLAIGFVGTKSSTLSAVSAKRVQDWNGGLSKILSWWPELRG